MRWPWSGTTPGKTRELHDELSSPAVWRRLAGVGARAELPVDLHTALAEYASSDGLEWNAVIADYARILGSVQLLLDAGIYFLHGPLTALGSRFCDAIVEEAGRLIPTLEDSPLRIVPSTLGDDAGALGAAGMAMEAWAPE